jgi:DNA-binding response OmpR family regulator
MVKLGMKKKILIASNLNNVLERKKTILDRASFGIFTTTSGKEALEIHKAMNVDLIIASLDLKDISGDDLCSMIRREQDLRQVSIILSCANEPSSIERASHCGANAYITRPFHSSQLTEKVAALLSIPQRQNYRVLLRISGTGKYSSESFYCSSCDISASGIMIETSKLMGKGDVLACSFFLPDFGQITSEAEIMRTDWSGEMHRYGIRFRHLDPKFREAIESFVSARSGKMS